jgi:hypothetical protein
MKLALLMVMGLCFIMPVALAADQASPARAVFTDSCKQLAAALSLQGDAQKRYVEECVKAKENADHKGAPIGPLEAAAGC